MPRVDYSPLLEQIDTTAFQNDYINAMKVTDIMKKYKITRKALYWLVKHFQLDDKIILYKNRNGKTPPLTLNALKMDLQAGMTKKRIMRKYGIAQYQLNQIFEKRHILYFKEKTHIASKIDNWEFYRPKIEDALVEGKTLEEVWTIFFPDYSYDTFIKILKKNMKYYSYFIKIAGMLRKEKEKSLGGFFDLSNIKLKKGS